MESQRGEWKIGNPSGDTASNIRRNTISNPINWAADGSGYA
jgi:hypothetical protein